MSWFRTPFFDNLLIRAWDQEHPLFKNASLTTVGIWTQALGWCAHYDCEVIPASTLVDLAWEVDEPSAILDFINSGLVEPCHTESGEPAFHFLFRGDLYEFDTTEDES